MKIDRSLIEDPLLYEIMYFSPIEVGDERHSNQLYFQTDIYARQMPAAMVEKLQTQIEQLRHVEMGMVLFDEGFRVRHRAMTLYHVKMALAYLDAREARIAMKLCDIGDDATKTNESAIEQHPQADFVFLRICTLSVKACAARRVKFFQKAIEALTEAKNICFLQGDHGKVHPLMTALTLLNLSAVLGDTDHDAHGLRWGLEALNRMYDLFSTIEVPEVVKAYYLVLACHNAALLSLKLGKWSETAELVDEGLEFIKKLNGDDDGLREKLIAIGAQAKHVPQGFLTEALNALNGWGEERGVWNLSFWDFSVGEIREEIRVLRHTTTLNNLIIELHDEDRRRDQRVPDDQLAKLILAAVSCQSLETLTISGIDFDPRKVWRRIKKRSFLETSWYASALNFNSFLESREKPDIAGYKGLMKDLNHFSKKLVLFLTVLGNECEGVDLSENGIGMRSITALVHALRRKGRPRWTRQVSTLILRSNQIDVDTARELAKTWDPPLDEVPEVASSLDSDPPSPASNSPRGASLEANRDEEPGVTSLDVSGNIAIGDTGFELLMTGVAQSKPFKALEAGGIGLQAPGCAAVRLLESTRLELLTLSDNEIGSEGAVTVVNAVRRFPHLLELSMDRCSIDSSAAGAISSMLKDHGNLRRISLNHNRLGSEGVIEFCRGAAESRVLKSVHLAYNEIGTVEAATAIGDLMMRCESLLEVNLSGNYMDPKGIKHIGGAIGHSRVLTLLLEDMSFTDKTIDDFLDNGTAETQDLQVMSLSGNSVGDDGLGIIAECLSIGLTDLALSTCALTAASQATLLNLVSLSPNLRSLDLSNNRLGPTGCSDMVSWMKQHEKDHFSLRSLELKNCSLGNEGLYQLVPILGSLSYVGASGNSITSAGLEAVMNSNTMIQLKLLDLGDNQIGEQGLHSLTQRFQQEHKRSLWNPKQLTSTIDTVILTGNPISSSLAVSTEAFLKVHNPLLTLVF